MHSLAYVSNPMVRVHMLVPIVQVPVEEMWLQRAIHQCYVALVSQDHQFQLVRAKLEPGLKISKLESDFDFLKNWIQNWVLSSIHIWNQNWNTCLWETNVIRTRLNRGLTSYHRVFKSRLVSKNQTGTRSDFQNWNLPKLILSKDVQMLFTFISCL